MQKRVDTRLPLEENSGTEFAPFVSANEDLDSSTNSGGIEHNEHLHDSAPPQEIPLDIKPEDLLRMFLSGGGNVATDESEEESINLLDLIGRPWETSRPFKPYQSVGEGVEGTGYTVAFSTGLFALSAVAAGVSSVLVAGSALFAGLSPFSALSTGLFAAADNERFEDESFLKHAINSTKQGFLSGIKTFGWSLAASAVCLLLAGAALLISAVLAVASVATAIIGTTVQATRLVGTAGAGIKSAVQSGMSLFSSKSGDAGKLEYDQELDVNLSLSSSSSTF